LAVEEHGVDKRDVVRVDAAAIELVEQNAGGGRETATIADLLLNA
jgi:hypothetical protein